MKPRHVIATVDEDFADFIVRCIEALEMARNAAVRSGDPNPAALACIDDDVRRLGYWIDWLPERMR
jgi:hypothetical protein